MRYFIDTEFLEGPQDKKFLGFKYGKTKPTIDLISIGIVSQDDREYYAISKDFNLEQAWEDEWIVNNVLLPIYKEFITGDLRNRFDFCIEGMSVIMKKYGKSNKQIAEEIEKFCDTGSPVFAGTKFPEENADPEFWAYYADYDWVVFCQLFGRMIDLPDGFPMYCRDLKQLMDDKVQEKYIDNTKQAVHTFRNAIEWLKNERGYPKNANKHHALWDAREDRDLYNFLINL